MSTILLVEDNPHILKINKETLTMHGYEILSATTAKECLELLSWHRVDLIVLDIMLPDGNGLSLCEEIKESYQIPILFLSALGENRDIIAGFRAGGDDYLSKPYDLDVFVARIEARLRAQKTSSHFLSYGSLKLDLLWGVGYIENEDMLLTPREFSVLLLLMRKAEKVVTTEELALDIWHDASEESVHALWTMISRLRKKLQSEKTKIEISSVRKSGYILERL